MKLSPIVEDKPSKAVRFESAYAKLWNAFPEHVDLDNKKKNKTLKMIRINKEISNGIS